MHSAAQEIAAHAARLVVEEGMEYGPAKRRAVKDLGLPARTPLPDNDRLEDEVREYIELFCADTQPGELAALRSLALVWMRRMAAFRPHLAGAVWRGTATRLSDIHIQLYCDDPKAAEIELINQNVPYEPRTSGSGEAAVEVLSVRAQSRELGEEIGVHFSIHDHDDLRGALKPDARGRSPRGTIAAVEAALAREAPSTDEPPASS